MQGTQGMLGARMLAMQNPGGVVEDEEAVGGDAGDCRG